jgi:hypothetical protein
MSRSIGRPLGCLLVAVAARAQSPIATYESQEPEVGFGMVLAPAGDVNGDGVPDAVTGSPHSQGPPSTATTLIAGVSALQAPFKGGVLVPVPDVLLPGLPLDASGALSLQSTWPASAPAGFSFWLQFWTPDAGAPKGFAASNGVMGTAP